MARIFCIPGIILLFAAFAFNFIASISLPYLPVVDITRTNFARSAFASTNDNEIASQIRFGVWTACSYDEEGHSCLNTGYAYNVTVANANGSNTVNITPVWTRGLAIHPVATAVSLLATILALSEHITVALFATLTAWLASTITLIAFCVDIALYAWTKHQFKQLDVGAKTNTAPGFWMTFIAFVLLFVGGLATCLGRIKDRRAKEHQQQQPHTTKDHNHVESPSDVKGSEITSTEKPAAAAPAAAPAGESKFGWGKIKFGKKEQV